MWCVRCSARSPLWGGAPLLPVLLWRSNINMFDIWQGLTVKVNLRERKGRLLYWTQHVYSILILNWFTCAEGSWWKFGLFFGGTWLKFKTADRQGVLIYWGEKKRNGFTCNPCLSAMLCKIFIQNTKLPLPAHMKDGTQLPNGENKTFQL